MSGGSRSLVGSSMPLGFGVVCTCLDRSSTCSGRELIILPTSSPRRTIATAQSLYFRFHLFFPLTEFPYLEVTLTCLYVSSKLHDTLKKPREIILASYALRYPDLLKGRAQLDPSAVDQKQLEQEKKKVQQVERLVLETICFNFLRAGEGAGSGKSDTFGLGVKVGRKMGCESSVRCSSRKLGADRLSRGSLETIYTTCLEDYNRYVSYASPLLLSHTPLQPFRSTDFEPPPLCFRHPAR
jgi:hypothetical protein